MRSNQLSYPAMVFFSECKGMTKNPNTKKNKGKIHCEYKIFVFLPSKTRI